MQHIRARELVLKTSAIQGELKECLRRIDRTPSTHTVRGMYVGGIVQAIASMGFEPTKVERIHAFKEYSVREYMELLLDSAISIYPGGGVHEGLRRLGGMAIPTFAKSMAGGVIMATAGRSWDLSLSLVSRGYELSLKPGKCTVVENANGRALIQLREVWNFCESYQIGVMEGLMQSCKLEGTVKPTLITPCDADLEIRWETARDAVSRRSRGRGEAQAGAGTAPGVR